MNFREIADKKLEDIERPALPPAGTYLWKVMKNEIRDVTSDKGSWEVVEFSVKAQAPTEDVDSDALAAYGNVANILNRVSFMFDKNDKAAFEQTQYQLKRFLVEHLKCASEDMSLSQGLAQSTNHQFLGTVVWKADKNDTELFHANIGKTAPAS